MTKEEKSIAIEEITDILKSNQNIYLADISGLNALQSSSLRRMCFKAGVKLSVVKNTLLEKAMVSSTKDFGELKKNNQDTAELSNQLEEIKENLHKKEELLDKILSDLNDFLLQIPNIPHEDVQPGNSEEDNKVIKTHGEVLKRDSIDHLEIASDIDTESAVKLAGARFSVLKNDIAKLHRALISFMLDVAEKNGYEERYVPFIANSQSLTGTCLLYTSPSPRDS